MHWNCLLRVCKSLMIITQANANQLFLLFDKQEEVPTTPISRQNWEELWQKSLHLFPIEQISLTHEKFCPWTFVCLYVDHHLWRVNVLLLEDDRHLLFESEFAVNWSNDCDGQSQLLQSSMHQCLEINERNVLMVPVNEQCKLTILNQFFNHCSRVTRENHLTVGWHNGSEMEGAKFRESLHLPRRL